MTASANSLNCSNEQSATAVLPSASSATAVVPNRQQQQQQPHDYAEELVENFYISNNDSKRNNVKIQVKLNYQGIYLRRETEKENHINEQLIRIEDIVGSHCGPRVKKRQRGALSSCRRSSNAPDDNDDASSVASANKDISAFLYIYAYVKSEKPLSRNRTVRILRFRTHERYEQNFKNAERWHNSIIIHRAMSLQAAKDTNKSSSASQQLSLQRKPYLVLLNPKSGMGKARELFQKQVAPLLKEAEINFDLQITTHANYARELARSRKDLVERYGGIIIAAGDGLFYEVLNGIMERSDWRMVCSMLPLGIIPCGSGNGLAKSIAHVHNEPFEPKSVLNAALTCVSGKTTLMDIVRVEVAPGGNTSNRKEMYSFLSIGWGIIADVDIESERLRSIGPTRFTLWSVHRMLWMRRYKGRLSWLPWQKDELAAKLKQSALRAEMGKTSGAAGAGQAQRQATSADEEFYDAPDDEDVFADVISLNSSRTTQAGDSWHSAASRRTAYYSVAGGSVRSHRSVAPSILSKIEAANAEYDIRASGQMPALGAALGEQWRSEEGEYVMVHAAYTTHLASDCLFVPDSKLNDGIIYLVIIRAGISRAQLTQFLLAMSSGTHLPDKPHPHIEILPVRAFRIEPAGKEGIMTVDGERVDYGPIQAEILPSLLKIMVPHQVEAATEAS